MESRRVILLLLLILLLGLAVRLFMARYENDIGVDSYHYALMGKNILQGQWDTWDPNGGRWTLPPFFPLLVALFHIFISNIETAGRAADNDVAEAGQHAFAGPFIVDTGAQLDGFRSSTFCAAALRVVAKGCALLPETGGSEPALRRSSLRRSDRRRT